MKNSYGAKAPEPPGTGLAYREARNSTGVLTLYVMDVLSQICRI